MHHDEEPAPQRGVTPIDLALHTWGDGQNRLLLLHGLSSSAAGWWRLGPDLAARGLEVIAPDLRGHGDTGGRDTLHAGIPGYVADVLAHGGGWRAVLGHSLGGRIVLECMLADPDFAQVVILEDPALDIPNDPVIFAELASEYDTPPTHEAFRVRYPRWHDTDIAGKIDALDQSSRTVVDDTLTAIADGDHWPDLAAVTAPVLVIGATPDNGGLVPRGVGAAVARQPNVEYVNIEGAGHSIHRDCYEPFWNVLVAFLRRHGVIDG